VRKREEEQVEEIVGKILEAEKEAEQLVQEARTHAAELRAGSDSESEKTLGDARERARQRIQEAIGKARSDAEAERERKLAQIEAEGQRFLEEHAEGIGRAAEKIVSLLVQPEYRKG
jgi:vacuolar-type H+-ATPase subunit H